MTAFTFLEGLRLRYFAPDELLYLGASHERNGLNDLPSRDLWENMVPTAWVADLARAHLGHPIRVLSGYRNTAYNRSVGGAAQSQHLYFRALDLAPPTDQVDRLFRILSDYREAGVFRGGIGKYTSFVHLDTRGVNATWGG